MMNLNGVPDADIIKIHNSIVELAQHLSGPESTIIWKTASEIAAECRRVVDKRGTETRQLASIWADVTGIRTYKLLKNDLLPMVWE